MLRSIVARPVGEPCYLSSFSSGEPRHGFNPFVECGRDVADFTGQIDAILPVSEEIGQIGYSDPPP